MAVYVLRGALLICFTVAAQTSQIPEWHLAGNNPTAYELSRDRESIHGGNASAMIRCRERHCSGFATLMQTIQSDAYQGRARLSGWVKATKGVRARLWMRVDGENSEMLAFDNMEHRSKMGPFDWQWQQVVLDVKPPAALINFGVIVEGNGTGWVDDIVVELVDRKVKSTSMGVQGSGPTGNPSATRRRYNTSKPQPANLDFEQDTGSSAPPAPIRDR